MTYLTNNSKKYLFIFPGSPFVKTGFRLTMLTVLLIIVALVPMNFSKIDSVFAQNGNSLGQEGDDNEASQSESSSQSTNQNSMCVSGESASLSCNNLSPQAIGSAHNEHGHPGPEGSFHQVVFSVEPGERNFDPTIIPFDLDLTGLVNTADDTGPRKDILFQVSWSDSNDDPHSNDIGECKVGLIFDSGNLIQVYCTGLVADRSPVLTVMAASANPLL